VAIRFNGVDNPKKYDGTSVSDLGGSPPNGDIVALYKDRIYVAGISPNYSTVMFSKVKEHEQWLADNNFDVNANDGDKIMAMEPLFDSLLLFKEYSIWELQVDKYNNPATLRYITLNLGTTSRESVKTINGLVYFFNRKGVWVFSQKYPELISLKIQKFIDAISNPYDVRAWEDGNKYNLYVGDLVVEGRKYENTVLVYDTMFNQWFIKCLAHKITSQTSFIKSDNTLAIYLGRDDGQAVLWNDGYSFAGKPIELEYESPLFQPGDPKKRKLFFEVLLRISRQALAKPKLSYSIDGGNWIDMGRAEEVYTTLPIVDRNISGRGREEGKDIRIRIHEVSTQQMTSIYQMIIYYRKLSAEIPKV